MTAGDLLAPLRGAPLALASPVARLVNTTTTPVSVVIRHTADLWTNSCSILERQRRLSEVLTRTYVVTNLAHADSPFPLTIHSAKTSVNSPVLPHLRETPTGRMRRAPRSTTRFHPGAMGARWDNMVPRAKRPAPGPTSASSSPPSAVFGRCSSESPAELSGITLAGIDSENTANSSYGLGFFGDLYDWDGELLLARERLHRGHRDPDRLSGTSGDRVDLGGDRSQPAELGQGWARRAETVAGEPAGFRLRMTLRPWRPLGCPGWRHHQRCRR